MLREQQDKKKKAFSAVSKTTAGSHCNKKYKVQDESSREEHELKTNSIIRK